MARLNTIKVPIEVDFTYNGTGYIENTDLGDYIGTYSFKDTEWTWFPKDIPRKENTMKVTKALRDSLIKSALDDRDNSGRAYNAAKVAYDEATKVYSWALNLIVGAELTTPTVVAPKVEFTHYKPATGTQRFFIPSKSGMTKGHYIYRATDGTVDCSCPGFINRGSCWASNQIKTAWWNTSTWATSASVFDNNRRLAYNVSYR